MRRLFSFKRAITGGAIAAVAVFAAACSSGGGDITPTLASDSTATVTAPTTVPVQNGTVTPTTTIGDIPSSANDLAAIDIVKAQEQVYTDLFADTVDSVVKIVTQSPTSSGEGSGWIWDSSGHIVTNYHVVQGARSVEVYFYDGHQFPATVVGFDTDADIAVIKIDPGDYQLQTSKLGDSSKLEVGQLTVALGNPFGQDFTMTTGIVSAVGRLLDSGFSAQSYKIPAVIQTDTAINPGNSGGPLLNIDGEVIGMNTQISTSSSSSSGVGFAVPVDLAKRVVPSLIEDGEHSYSYLGISGGDVNRTVREALGLGAGQTGAYIEQVQPRTPAAAAGLIGDGSNAYGGDIIVSIDGQKVDSIDDVIAYLSLYTSPGEDVVLGVLRAGQEIAVTVTLGSR
jgi:2-alkenal reductase